MSCGRPCSEFCFHNCVNGVKSSKTVRVLSVGEVVITDFCSGKTREPTKSFLTRKPVHKSVSSERFNLASVESNVGISVSRTSACLNRNSSVPNRQEYCNLLFLGSFNFRIPFQNVLTNQIFLYFYFSFYLINS